MPYHALPYHAFLWEVARATTQARMLCIWRGCQNWVASPLIRAGWSPKSCFNILRDRLLPYGDFEHQRLVVYFMLNIGKQPSPLINLGEKCTLKLWWKNDISYNILPTTWIFASAAPRLHCGPYFHYFFIQKTTLTLTWQPWLDDWSILLLQQCRPCVAQILIYQDPSMLPIGHYMDGISRGKKQVLENTRSRSSSDDINWYDDDVD